MRNSTNAQRAVRSFKIFFYVLKVSQETRRSVAVNTEMHERFEKELVGLNIHMEF